MAAAMSVRMRVREVAKGLATFVPGLMAARRSAAPTPRDSLLLARQSYAIWMRHLVYAHGAGLPVAPPALVELGPGSTLGVGLAALLCGSESYVGLDAVRLADPQADAEVLDELGRLFALRSDIPGSDEFPLMKPYLDSYAFPSAILGEQDDGALAGLLLDRVAQLRSAVAAAAYDADVGPVIRYLAPWRGEAAIFPGTKDLVIAQAVMQYVPDLVAMYRTMYEWLRPGGRVSLQIDYSCHGTSDCWDGHWAYSPGVWRVMRGRREVWLNRLPHSTHVRCLREAGFEMLQELRVTATPATPRRSLAMPFASMVDDDRSTKSAFILARRT